MCEISGVEVMKSRDSTYIVEFCHDGERFNLPFSEENGSVLPWRMHPTRYDVICEIAKWCKSHCQDCRKLPMSSTLYVEAFPERFVPIVEDFEDIVDNATDIPLGSYPTEERCGVFHDVWYSPWRHGYIRTEVAEFSRAPRKYWQLRRYFHSQEGLQCAVVEQVERGRSIAHWAWKKLE